VESIGRAVGSATKLTRQLLAFSRRQALVPEVVSLAERLPAMEDLLHPVLGGRVHLTLSVQPGTAPILVDSAEFELALINLAINARDAMPAGGSFAVSARNATADEVPPLLQGAMVMVEARDSGAGIPPEVIAKVFEPFFTTKPVGQGTGLGLSQVYGLCQRAGGLATVESALGQGTVVRLFFPVAQGSAAAPDAPVTLQRNLDKRVLMVEDNDEVAGALQLVLEAMGCTVTRLDRAQGALELLAHQARRQPARPDAQRRRHARRDGRPGAGAARAAGASGPAADPDDGLRRAARSDFEAGLRGAPQALLAGDAGAGAGAGLSGDGTTRPVVPAQAGTQSVRIRIAARLQCTGFPPSRE
jgi:CheY-like chemotaxis protein